MIHFFKRHYKHAGRTTLAAVTLVIFASSMALLLHAFRSSADIQMPAQILPLQVSEITDVTSDMAGPDNPNQILFYSGTGPQDLAPCGYLAPYPLNSWLPNADHGCAGSLVIAAPNHSILEQHLTISGLDNLSRSFQLVVYVPSFGDYQGEELFYVGEDGGTYWCRSSHFGSPACDLNITDAFAQTPAMAGSANCGDGIQQGTEQCDDGRDSGNHDGCVINNPPDFPAVVNDQTYMCRQNVCGDTFLYIDHEQCDDGNINNGDGCDSTCHIEPGYTCTGNPGGCSRTEAYCGDGNVDEGEQCDDGDQIDTNDCNNQCVENYHYEFSPANKDWGTVVPGSSMTTDYTLTQVSHGDVVQDDRSLRLTEDGEPVNWCKLSDTLLSFGGLYNSDHPLVGISPSIQTFKVKCSPDETQLGIHTFTLTFGAPIHAFNQVFEWVPSAYAQGTEVVPTFGTQYSTTFTITVAHAGQSYTSKISNDTGRGDHTGGNDDSGGHSKLDEQKNIEQEKATYGASCYGGKTCYTADGGIACSLDGVTCPPGTREQDKAKDKDTEKSGCATLDLLCHLKDLFKPSLALTACPDGDKLCIEPTHEGPINGWCGGLNAVSCYKSDRSSLYCGQADSGDPVVTDAFVCPEGSSRCKPLDQTCLEIGGTGPFGSWCATGVPQRNKDRTITCVPRDGALKPAAPEQGKPAADEFTIPAQARLLQARIRLMVSHLTTDLTRFADSQTQLQDWIDRLNTFSAALDKGLTDSASLQKTDTPRTDTQYNDLGQIVKYAETGFDQVGQETTYFFDQKNQAAVPDLLQKGLDQTKATLALAEAALSDGSFDACTVAHEIGHNLGMSHDAGQSDLSGGDFTGAAKILDQLDASIRRHLAPAVEACTGSPFAVTPLLPPSEIFDSVSGIISGQPLEDLGQMIYKMSDKYQLLLNRRLKQALADGLANPGVDPVRMTESLTALDAGIPDEQHKVMDPIKTDMSSLGLVFQSVLLVQGRAETDADFNEAMSSLVTLNWCPPVSDDLLHRTQAAIGRVADTNDVTVVKSFEDAVHQAASKNDEACFNAGISKFRDISTSQWYFPYFQSDTFRPSFSGDSKPADETLRAEALMAAMRAAGYEGIEGNCDLSPDLTGSTDIPSWANCAANMAYQHKFLTAARLDRPIHREEVAEFMHDIVGDLGLETTINTEHGTQTDADALKSVLDLGDCTTPQSELAQWFRNNVMGGTDADGGKNLNCQQFMNRAELAAVMARFKEVLDFYRVLGK